MVRPKEMYRMVRLNYACSSLCGSHSLKTLLSEALNRQLRLPYNASKCAYGDVSCMEGDCDVRFCFGVKVLFVATLYGVEHETFLKENAFYLSGFKWRKFWHLKSKLCFWNNNFRCA